MNAKSAVAIFLVAIFALTSLAAIPIRTVKANDEAQIYIDPSVVNKTPFDVGTTFDVTVKLANYVNLAGFDINITWDGALITCTSVNYNATLDALWTVGNWSTPVEKSGVGYYELVAVALATSASNTGAQALFKMTFKVDIGDGVPLQTPIHFGVVLLSDNSVPIPKPIVAVATDGMYYMATTFHDVAVTNVTTCKDGGKPFPIVGRYCQMHINATVANQGSYTETFNVTIYASNATASIAINQTKLTLPNATFVVIQFQWNATLPYGNYTISAVADTVPGETDTADNTYVGTMVLVDIVGDLTGDYHVIGIDLNTLLVSFGAPTNPARPYNPNCDFNDDHIITGRDLNILLVHFGQHYP